MEDNVRLTKLENAFKNNQIKEHTQRPDWTPYLSMGIYVNKIKAVFEAFGKDNVMLITLDDLENNTAEIGRAHV